MVDFCQLQQFVREGNTVATSKAMEEETEDQICLLSKKIEMEQVKSKTPRVFPLFADSLGENEHCCQHYSSFNDVESSFVYQGL